MTTTPITIRKSARLSFVRLTLSLTLLLFLAAGTSSQAASDTDVRIIEAKSVTIEKDRIIIVGKAVVSMRVFVPEGEPATTPSRLFGRDATWIKIAADEGTFTILRPKAGEKEWWDEMSVDAARDLKNGKEIGRIGFYRPEVVLKGNAVHSITGAGYLYPKRDE